MIKKYALFRVFDCLRKHNKLSVRATAKEGDVGVATAKRWLDYLHDNKIINLAVYGRMFQYSLNEESMVTRQIKIAFSVAEISKSGIVQELRKHPQIVSIVLYGSLATGKDSPQSDVDILVIARRDIKVNTKTYPGREVCVTAFTQTEWRNKAKKDKPFYDSIITQGIALYGELPVVI